MTPEQLARMTWEEFKTGLYDKYIPKNYRKAKEVEFYNLKQGQMSVTEYDRMFCDMSRYAPGQVDTDDKIAEKFCAGLRHEIRMALASHGGLSYSESLSRALDIEAAMPREKSTALVVAAPPPQQQQNSREKRKRDEDQTPHEDKKRQTAKNHPKKWWRRSRFRSEGRKSN